MIAMNHFVGKECLFHYSSLEIMSDKHVKQTSIPHFDKIMHVIPQYIVCQRFSM